MAPQSQRRWWRRCRLVFRAFRIAVLLVLLVLVALFAYLNEVGLPDFLKRPLVEELGKRGVELQFTRLRLRWYRGIVAENVRFGKADVETNGPVLSLKEVQVQLNHEALSHFRLEVESLILSGGRLAWPVPETNRAPRELVATNLQAQLRFLTNDQWKLDNFKADFAGANLQLTGAVTNASALRDWRIFHPQPGAGSNAIGASLRRVADLIDELKFTEPPELDVQFDGDARDLRTFNGSITLSAPGADTPWGSVTNGDLQARLTAPKTAGGEPEADVQLRAEGTGLAFASGGGTHEPAWARNLYLHLHAVSGETLTNLIQARLEISAQNLWTVWGLASNANVKAEWTHSLTNLIPLSGTAEIHLANAQVEQGTAGALDLTARLNPSGGTPPPATDDRWAWWAALAPYPLDWDCRLENIHAEDPQAGVFDLKELACSGTWRAPGLTFSNVHAELYRGKFDARATVDVVSRETEFSATADFDIQKIAPLLSEMTRHLLEQYSWEAPPLGHVTGHAVLPEWTNFHPDWRRDFVPTVYLSGDVQVGNAAFRGVPFGSAFLHYIYSNMVWYVPDLVAMRPEGRLELSNESDDRTHWFHFHVKSSIDPRAARHLLPPEGQKGLDAFIFTQPPFIETDVWGYWHKAEELGLQGHVTITNFALRNESATRFDSDIRFTNGFFVLSNGRIDCGERYMTASGLGVDLEAHKAYLTNGFSTLESGPFFRVVGSKVAHVMEPYQFSEAPTVRGYGTIPLAEDIDPDLHFQVDGGPFHWMLFNLEHVNGQVDWVGHHLSFVNARSEFYGGRLEGGAGFDFTDERDAAFHFNLVITDADLHALMSDVSSKTNRLEGRLNGSLDITNANTADLKSWSGNGVATLNDGLLWDVPVFGMFSPILNKLAPGLGNSRADQGSATFTITNSVIYSDNLSIHAPQIVMQYRGTVDFKGRVDAVVQAKLFREIPVIGPVVTEMLTPLTMLFEYQVTGTLEDPKMEEKYLVSKIPRMLLSPFQLLKDITPPANAPSATPDKPGP